MTKIMTRPVLTMKEEATLKEAARTLANNRVNQLGVVNASGAFAGAITERDVVKEIIVDTHQPKLSPERVAIYLAMTDERVKEQDWMDKAEEAGFKTAVTQVGAKADKLAWMMREAAVVAAIMPE